MLLTMIYLFATLCKMYLHKKTVATHYGLIFVQMQAT